MSWRRRKKKRDRGLDPRSLPAGTWIQFQYAGGELRIGQILEGRDARASQRVLEGDRKHLHVVVTNGSTHCVDFSEVKGLASDRQRVLIELAR